MLLRYVCGAGGESCVERARDVGENNYSSSILRPSSGFSKSPLWESGKEQQVGFTVDTSILVCME